MQNFPPAEFKTASKADTKKLYRDALVNFKQLNDGKENFLQKLRQATGLILCVGWLYHLTYYTQVSKTYTTIYFGLVPIFLYLDDIRKLNYAYKAKTQYVYQYLKTCGSITQIKDYDKDAKKLHLEVKFTDLDQQEHCKNLVIAYPDFHLALINHINPELLLDQSVELCFTPDLQKLLQIRTYHAQPDELPIITYQLNKHELWQRHQNYLLHPSYFYPQSIRSIYFVRKENEASFDLVFKNETEEFRVNSSSTSLTLVEDFIFAPYSDFFMQHQTLQPSHTAYRKLKFSNGAVNIELWKNPESLKFIEDISQLKQNLKRKAFMLITPCLLIACSVFFMRSQAVGLIMLILLIMLGVLIYSVLLQQNHLLFKSTVQL